VRCEELKLRLVDPASARVGGHAPVISHLEDCASCRESALMFGLIERLFRPEALGAPPPDLELRVHSRLLRDLDRTPRRRNRPIWMAVAAAAAVGVLAYAVFRSEAPAPAIPKPRPAIPAAAGASPPASAGEMPRAAIESAASAPVTLAERKEVGEMFDADFLASVEALEGLDPFFPLDAVAPPAIGPPSPEPTPIATRPPETPDSLLERILIWRQMPEAGRRRLSSLDAAYRARPASERVALEARWTVLSKLGPEEHASARRLGLRIRELDVRKRDKLKVAVRSLAPLPPETRIARFGALPFADTLTGQEKIAAERLLAPPAPR
jgi:hypothetical protein